jgi:hypothetical protein
MKNGTMEENPKELHFYTWLTLASPPPSIWKEFSTNDSGTTGHFHKREKEKKKKKNQTRMSLDFKWKAKTLRV